jgi:signal transduction histidine kinase
MTREKPDGGTILIVDDDLRNIRVLDRILQGAGYNLLVARNGMEAVDRAERGRPNLILLDVMMPGRDGYETCAKLKSLPRTLDIPVIFLSALGDSESVMKGFRAGGVDFVTKPFRQEEVLARVGVHLALQRDRRKLRNLTRSLKAEAKARKRTAVALAESENRLNEAQTLAAMGNWETDFETGTTQWSENLFRLLGYEPGEAPPSLDRLQSHLHPEDRDRFRELLNGCLNGDPAFKIEFRYIPVFGGVRHAHAVGKIECGEAGEALRFYGGMQDVTREKVLERDRRRMERRLQARRRLESLGVMAGGIAHDFNNILMGALGNLELARQDLPPEGRTARFLAQSESSLFRAVELVRQMLAYSGKSHFVFSDVVPEIWLRDARPLMEKALPPSATLDIDAASDLPAVSGDSEQLGQLLVNLAVNAAESYPEGATAPVRVRLRSRTCAASELFQTIPELWSAYAYPLAAGRFLAVEVADDGEGMDAEVRKRIFEPFFSTKFPGRGLGLAVVLGIARGHGGYLRVDSTPGGGTTIRLLLPAETDRPENGARDCEAP